VYTNKEQRTGFLWYAIHTRSKFERVAFTSLSAKGYKAFLPLYRSSRRWSDRSKELDLPLFPGYVFCAFDVQELLPIVTTPGVTSIVCAGKTPVSIPDSEIEAIQTMIRSGLHAQPWPHLAAGTKVVIEKGPLAGIEGIAMSVNKRYRLIVSVSLLQRSVAVEIDREWARPLSTSTDTHSVSSAGKFLTTATG
jgi:transcription antitermination factor NusG